MRDAGQTDNRRDDTQTPRGRSVRAAGFTLIEVLVASSILGMAVAGLVMPLSLAAKHQQLDAYQTTAATLMTQMMERLIAKRYDDVLAMDGYEEIDQNITNPAGEAMNETSMVGYTLKVTAVEVVVPAGEQTQADAPRYCLATVSVSHPMMDTVSISRLFARFDP